MQCLARWRQHLPLTTLELATITYVWCSWDIYGQWLLKPLDVDTPTILKIKASTAEILTTAGPAASKPYEYTPLDFVWNWHVSWTTDIQPHLHFRAKIPDANGFPIRNPTFEANVVTLGHISIIVPLGMLYVLSRLCVMDEALASLRALPEGAFQDIDWTKFIPHY